MTFGEIAYLGLVLSGFIAFAVVLFWVAADDRMRTRKATARAALEAPPSGGARAHA